MLELFEQLGCRVSYREEGATWAMVEQEGLRFDIQFIERDREPMALELKRESHVAFISSDPKREMERIEKWIESQGKTCMADSWSDKEYYFDCPEVFVDFVIEVMHRSVVE
ncbi:hypothetical protein CO174_00550 [Candidatus Uhrbacteria bacterium CG_4_9_14_3_um_filter_50_9]|uniref:VOC domain-containing protein n=1 Tax=Candidatus Uhrbacteria bacterium CG_4_9_14_3_um_filter_50_9 TaxID=1975035 RepID=A0A2M7XEB2_9BACT|nr:MAG: hypothetical protein CO174_00550 [Candidatus Uhrbacteria bacterium CG_4_9_14_3_um_filter_50_9]